MSKGMIYKMDFLTKEPSLVSLYSGEIKIFKCDSPYTSTPIKVLDEHKRQVFAFSFIQETNQLLTGSIDGTLRIWNANNYQCISVIEELYPECIFPIDRENVIAGGFRSLYIINVRTGTVETVDLLKNAKIGTSEFNFKDKQRRFSLHLWCFFCYI